MKRLLFVLSLLVVTSGLISAEELDSSNSIAPKTTRIVGGDKSLYGAWPSTVALLDVNKINDVELGIARDTSGLLIPFNEANAHAQYCGASLIASKWVLTAAHCVANSSGNEIEASRINALVGTSNLSSGGERVTVKKIIIHPSYDHANTDADIALLELDYDVGVATMPVSADDVPTGLFATVVGWGALREDESLFPYELYEVEIPIVSRSSCEDLYGSSLFTPNMFCAGYEAGVKDSCTGDSGGPLMVVQNGQTVQAGITSWGVGCGQAGQYGVYTRLSNFRYWIDSTTATTSSSSGGGSFIFLLFPFLFIIFSRVFLKEVDR